MLVVIKQRLWGAPFQLLVGHPGVFTGAVPGWEVGKGTGTKPAIASPLTDSEDLEIELL